MAELEAAVPAVTADDESDLEDHAPKLAYWRLFLKFFLFGLRAFGGPAVQIAAFKEQMVLKEKWVSVAKFNRVYAVYQVLPGPEATELCCYFGHLSRGRLGGLCAGLGFMLPGFVAMFIMSWIYNSYGLTSRYFVASMLGMQPCAAAMSLRAVHKLGEHSFRDGSTKLFSWLLFSLGAGAAIASVMRINWFVALFWLGVVYVFVKQALTVDKRWFIAVVVWSLVAATGYVCYAIFHGLPEASGVSVTVMLGNDYWQLFVLGLLGGLLSFGGAYTAVPFIRSSAVGAGWITSRQFLDGLALGSIVPSPLSIFVTFVGWVGHGPGGAVLMTLGMFLPAFSFTIIGHPLWERLTRMPRLATFLDGISAAVVGLVFITSIQLVDAGVQGALSAVIFATVLQALYIFKHPALNPICVLGGAIAGQLLFVDSRGR